MKKKKTYMDVLSIGTPAKVSYNKVLLVICIVSGVWIAFYKLVLIDIKPCFEKAYEVGELMFMVLSSILVSGIFYYINIYLEQRRVRKIMYPILKERLLSISVIANGIITVLSNGTMTSLGTEDEFIKQFNTIDLNNKPTTTLLNANHYTNWKHFFHDRLEAVRYHSDMLYKYSSHMSPEVFAMLSRIQYSDFENSIDNVIDFPDTQLGFRASTLYMFLIKVQKLSSKEAIESIE